MASNYSGAANAATAGAEATYDENIEIISTGIPALLKYSPYSNNNKKFNGTIYSSTGEESARYPYMKDGGTSGLMYNFRNVGFNKTADNLNSLAEHYGGFKSISVNGIENVASTTNIIISDTLFRANTSSGTVNGMRTLSLLDLKGSNNSNTNTSSAVTDPIP